MKFTVMGTLPTLNEIIEASKKHHMQYAKMKKDFTALVMIHCMNLPKVKKADFEITWYCQDKRKDKDNIVAGQKFIFDGLVKAGVLQNDGWQQIGDVTHKFEVDKSRPRIEVKIKELV
ncbi:Holliday junction resolvase [Oceanobacillus kimchii]|uniref:Holliday junction resolvase n=1 Tax=Oceanobacillus kimchii TaxID=746691 RepID=UPI00232E0009|nr:Holliday junction resolvase [Oceanobacillus kimchii]